MKIGIIGGGAWGSALKVLVQRKNHSVDEDLAAAELWLIAVPAAYFRASVIAARDLYRKQPIIICTKGMEPGTHLFMSEVLAAELPESDGLVGVLSGPQFAAEVASGVATGSTLAGSDAVLSVGLKALGEFYLEETNDVVGVQICGCGKNAAAIVAGFYSEKSRGENERAMMLSRAWSEVVDFGLAFGADARTFSLLCGVGDLFLSAASATSRNFSAGVAIARGEPVVGTVEGLSALQGLALRAKALGVKTPVLNSIEKILFEL